MTLPANIRINVGAPFPSRVKGASFVVVSKANGVWTITPNYRLLTEAPSLNINQVVVVFDPTTGIYSLVSVLNIIANGFGSYREVTSSGDVALQTTDIVILMDKTAGSATNINLSTSASRFGLPITVKDLKGDANTNNITFVPASGETIDGFSGSAAAANGVALIDINYGSKTLYPLSSGGWYVR